jgi:hypothetical protein
VGWTGWFQGRLASQPVGIAEALCAIVLMMACETLVEPLYVASGFSLYLNRRSELEGWDLELVFRRMQRRLVAALRHGLGGLGGFSLILLVVAGCWSPQSVHAAPAPITPAAHGAALPPTVIPVAGGPIAGLAEAREQAHKVLLDPVFGQNVIQWHWQPRTASTPEAQPNLPAWLVGLARMAGRLVEALAFFLGWGVRVVLALLLGVVLLLAIVWAVRWNRGRSGHRSRPDLPISLFGLDVREEGLPTDVARAARVLIDAGEFSAALSLLYRACLVALIHRAHIRFRSGDTEDRCLERVVGHVDPASFEYFSRLVEAWRMTAYAHRPPEREGLTVLAASWTSHFGPDAALEGDRA